MDFSIPQPDRIHMKPESFRSAYHFARLFGMGQSNKLPIFPMCILSLDIFSGQMFPYSIVFNPK